MNGEGGNIFFHFNLLQPYNLPFKKEYNVFYNKTLVTVVAIEINFKKNITTQLFHFL